MTFAAGSPCAKIVVAGSYSMRCSGTPVQSTSSAGVSAVALFDLLIAVAALWRASYWTQFIVA
jgi:hypothetical protein